TVSAQNTYNSILYYCKWAYLSELLRGPSFFPRNLHHPRSGIDHHGVAEQAQHGVVGVVVGVSERLGEVYAVLAGEVLDDGGLEVAVGVVALDLPGELAVYHLHVGGDQVVGSQVVAQWLKEEVERAGEEDDGVALGFVLLDGLDARARDAGLDVGL